MSNVKDNRKWVYDTFTNKGYNLGDYTTFESNINKPETQDWLFEKAKEEGINLGSINQFRDAMFQQEPETKERILNNIPDYFQSKGTNLFTHPLENNAMESVKPANAGERIVQDEQQRIQLAERAANDPYMKQQELEHVFKPKNQEQIDSVRQLINSARQQRVKERQQRVKSAGGGGIFSTMSQAYLAGEQNDADKQLEYASTLIEQAQNITNESKKKGNTNFFSGFARGFKDAPLDGWAMGLQDLKNYSSAKKVMDKVDRGEELSPSEDALMQALVTNAATQMYYSGDLGRGYKAGGVTAESLPFMLDMIAGMGTIQSVTKPASKALVKYATEKAAKMGLGRATTGLAKGAARTAAGLGDVAAHTATFGGARVAADYQRRGLGDVQVSPEQDGTVSYAGRDNAQTGAEAIGKSIVSTAAETGSELLGEYFAPMLGWVGKVTGANRLGKIIPASVGKAYSSIINSNGFKQVQEIARRAKIADPIGEYGEEVVNNLVSTAIGDMTPDQLVDIDNNIDTFLGVAPMSALFGAAGTGGYLREKYRNYRNMREFENQMRDTMGEDWSGVREALQDADIDTARGMVKEVLSSNMQPDIKKKAINYISSVLQEQTLQEADKQIAPEEMIQNKRFIISNLNEARNNIEIGEEELNSAVSILNQEGESALSELYDAETVQKIVEYKNAYDDYLNYTYWVQNQAYDARKEAESQVERMTNATTGTVMRVKSGLSQNPVNILRGNIVFDAEGNVDKDSSDNTIYYLSEDGNVKMAPISMFESLVDDTPADELAYQAGEDAEQEFIQTEEAQIMQPEQSVQPIELGTTFQKDGATYEVTQKSPDGYVVGELDKEGGIVKTDIFTEEQLRTAMTPAIQEEQTSQEQSVQSEDVTQPEPQQVQNEPQTAISRIPVNENGEHDFESAPYQDTSSALIEISENVDDAKDTAAQMINHYQEELKKADKAKTTGNTIQEIVRLKQQKKANIQSINDKIAYWNSVANDIESKRPGGIIEQAKEESDANQQRLSEMTAEQQQAAQQEVQKKIDVFSYTDAKSNIPAYRGAYYSDGTVTATNGFTLIRLQATYPSENEGKVISKKGEDVENVRYPKVELIIPKGEQEEVTVDKESVRAKLNEIETKLKEEWEKSDKKTPYKTLKAITTVKVNIGGVTHNISIERLTALLDGMDAIGTNQVGITKSIAYAKNGKQLIAVAFNAKDIDDIYDSLSISDETYSEDTINQMKRVGVPLTDLEGIPKSEDGMFQIYGIQNVVGETMYFVSSPGKTVKNMDENYVGTGDRMFKSLDEAIKGAEEERASYQRTKADREEREERVRQRIEEERKAQEAKDATPLGKFLKTLNRLQAGKADGILSDNVSFNGETMSKADFIQRVIADGYAAEEYLDGTKIKYRLVKDGKGYKINKTEFDFAKFAGAGTIEVENKDDLINLERLSRKYADKGVYTMADIDKRIASTERRLKGTNENGKEGKELKKALEELNELKRLKEMQNSTRTKQEENVESQNTSDEQTNESGLTDSNVEQERTSPKERIEDTGEKIGGARKDIIRKYADKINLSAQTFSKMFPKPDIKALVEAGVPIKDAAAVKAMYDIAKAEYKRRKSTANSVFFAMYAKQVLSGDRSKELVYNGVVFTEYGKEIITANEKAYAALYERLGLEYSDIDLYDFRIIPRSGFDTRIINFNELNRQNQELSKRRGKNVKYLDGDKVNFVIGPYHRAENQFETIEDAIDAFVERVKKETKLDAPKYSPSIYWKKKDGYTDYSTTWVGTKIKGFGLVDVKSFKNSSEARKWLAEHQEDFQQMSAAEESRLNEEKKEGVASYTQIIEKEVNAFVVKIKVRGIGQPIEVKRFPIEGERYSRERSLNYKKMMDESSQWAKSEECKQISDEIAQNALSAKKGKVKIKTETDKMRERVGEDYRSGRDITTNELLDTFGFRAIEFGNYVSQKERQSFLNNIYDSLMDMSKILGISPKGLSLGGKLAIAYGARGKSAASGHYEPYKNVINVTKTSGNGVFAHEWMHALDYYFSNFNPENIYSSAPHATSGEYKSDIRDEVKSSFDNLMSVIKASDYYKRSVALNEYYSSDTELAARALQDYIIRKLEERGQVNDFLSNHITPEEWSGSEKTYPFPSGKEVETIGEAFNNLFDTIDEKVDEEGNTTLFREEGNPDTRFRFIGEQGAANLDAAEEANTRLDNLAVAREMEKSGKDAKSIKIATGWERGSDGKWRYEEEDFEYIPKGNAREKSLLEREPWHKELMSLSDKVYNGEKLSNEEEVRFDELSKKETELKDSLKKSDIKFLDDYVSDNTLFKEYPELKQVKVEFYDGSFFDGGSYSHHDMTIRINNNSPLDAKSILVHEVQHAIQHIEGFSRGGNSRTYRNYLNSLKEKRDAWSMIDEFEEKSKELGSDASKMDVYKAVRDEYTSLGMSFGDGIMPSRDAFDEGFNLWVRGYDKEGYEDAYKEYQNLIEKFGLGESKDRYHELSGEVEARNVQSRLNMTPEERRNTLASETEDVAREDQIFLYDSMGASSMVIDANQIAESLNVPVQVINSIDEVPEGAAKEAIQKGRKVKGWYDVKTGKVYVYLPNATSAEDVKQTILHEGIAHFGLRQLVGEERMDDFLDEVFSNVSGEVRRKITDSLPKYGYNSRVATEEYMASIAENGVDVSTWERIKQAFKNLLRRIGINIQINDNELKYILWRSAQNLDKNRPIDLAIDVAMQYNMGVGNYFREGESDGSREEYENSLQGWKYKAREAYQDSMLALKNLQEVIANVSGKPIKSFEDAYKAENQLSSKNTAEAEEYYEKFFKPMLEAEGKMMKNYGLSHKEIERYMMLAHGIERNVEMTFRERLNEIINTNPNDAQQFADDFIMERDRLRNMYSGYEYLKALSDYIGEVGDFSAAEAILTSIDNEEHTDFQNDALEYVKDFESKYDTSALWDKTNRATKETLKKTYESGMMDKDHFAKVSKMFMYYVPLRGWNEKTAEDVYEYINSERSPLNSVLKSMKGRKSVPDEVMATIGNMAESAILQGNKNLMKQSFMNMVMNHPTDVATMRKAWYVYDQAKDEWTISMPEIQDNDTPEVISQKISDHEEKMKNLKEKGLATQKSSGLNIDYRILKNNISQHAVVVKNGGKDYIIYVNGNPRAAQAVNGLTNPDAEKNPIFNSISRANRWLAANFTTRNPAFVMSNLARDMIFSMSAIGIKEDAKYSAKFRKNLFVAIPTVFDCIRGKCKNSQSDMYFKEFVKNGGETGYMHLNDVDKYKKKVKKELSKITGERGSAKAALDYTLERLEDFNRWAEDVSRFAVYMTSRQMGRSIVDSVNDAKEVTVNFNKKGAGYKTGGFFGITAGIMRNLYLFFNASAQSLSNFNRLRVKNPVRFYSTLGGFIAAGVIMPVINDFLYNVLGGGDDNPYNDLPEWVRRNNLCIYAGNGQFVTIPLPIELRAFYGLGDYAYQLSTGREKPTPTGIAKGTVSQLADLLPLNPTGNEGLKTFMPDALSPIFETYVWNEDFTGKPIAKLTPFNERDPEWKRVYKGTSGWLVDASKFFNDLTNGGGPGSDFRKGFIDFNPAKVENLLESYFGGMAKFLNQSGKTIYYGAKSMAEGEMDENLVARNVPIVNRFYNKVDDRNAFSGINTEYFNLRDEMEQFKYELNGVKKNYRNNPGEYRQIVNSEMFRKYMRYKPYQDRLDRLYKMAKELEGQERKQVEDMIVEIRRELVNSLK